MDRTPACRAETPRPADLMRGSDCPTKPAHLEGSGRSPSPERWSCLPQRFQVPPLITCRLDERRLITCRLDERRPITCRLDERRLITYRLDERRLTTCSGERFQVTAHIPRVVYHEVYNMYQDNTIGAWTLSASALPVDSARPNSILVR